MRHLRFLAILVLTSVVAATPSSASAPTISTSTASLPTGVSQLYQGYLPLESCVRVGNCVIAGIGVTAAGYQEGFVDSQKNGAWATPVVITPPTGFAVAQGVTLNGLSCPSVGSCVIAGQYVTSAGSEESFIFPEVAGQWKKAVALTLPGNAAATNQQSTPHDVQCASAGNCVAIGTYSTSTTPFAVEAYASSEVNGIWQVASELVLPTAVVGNPFTTLSQLSCWGQGNCAAAGSYVDDNNVHHAFVDVDLAGRWRPSQAIVLPGNASAFAGASISEISCSSQGACGAIGAYNATSGSLEPLAVNGVGAVWQRAVEVRLPSNAATTPVTMYFGFRGISCPDNGDCTFGGQYLDNSGHYQGFLANETNGTWSPATEMALPTGAVQAGHNGGVVAVSCVAAGSCAAAGAYIDAHGRYQSLYVSESKGVWSQSTTVSLPGTANTVGVDGGAYTVQCFTPGVCALAGSYLVGTSTYLGFFALT